MQEDVLYHDAASRTVDLANRIANEQEESDVWEVADGMLAGALQYWLYSRQPCEDPACEECASINTAESRLALLLETVREIAEASDYYHSPNDINVGRA